MYNMFNNDENTTLNYFLLHYITIYFFLLYSPFSRIIMVKKKKNEYISLWLIFPQASFLSCDYVWEGKVLHDSKGDITLRFYNEQKQHHFDMADLRGEWQHGTLRRQSCGCQCSIWISPCPNRAWADMAKSSGCPGLQGLTRTEVGVMVSVTWKWR